MKIRKVAVLILVLVGLALGAPAHSADAHAQYIRSQPEENAVLTQAPVEVLIFFTEAIDIGFSEIQVIDSTGAQQDNGDTHVHSDPTNPGITLKPLAPGTYTVAWSVLSTVDGHRTSGTFAFSVGQLPGSASAPPVSSITFQTGGSAPPRWLSVLNRWVAFAAMAALLGATVFPALVLAPALKALKGAQIEESDVRAARVLRGTVIAGLITVAVTTAISLWLQAWAARGDATSLAALRDVWTDTRFGEIWTLRVGLIAAAVMFSVMALRKLPLLMGKRDFRQADWLTLTAAVVALPLTSSLNSHAAAARSDSELYSVVDWLHLVAGGIWAGGLFCLLLVLLVWASRRQDRAEFLAAVIPRFSAVAVPTVAIIVATGAIQWWHNLRGVFTAFDSDYGWTLAVKVVLLTPLLLLAAFNLLIVRPRFLSFVLEGMKEASSRVLAWEGRLRWAVAGEVAVVVVILGVTALLTETSTPRRGTAAGTNGNVAAPVATPSGFAQSLRADDLNLSLDVYPGIAGQNELGIFLNDADGDERQVQQVILRFKYLDESLGENEDFAEPFHPPTHYTLSTSQLSLTGSWQIEVIVRREGLLDARGTFTVQIAT